MIVTSLLHQLDAEDLTRDIIRKEDQIKNNNSTPLINDLPKAEWLKKIKEEKPNGVIKQFKLQVKSKRYFAK